MVQRLNTLLRLSGRNDPGRNGVRHGLRLAHWAALHGLDHRSRLNRTRLHGGPGLNRCARLYRLGHRPLGDRSHRLDGPLLDHGPLLDGLAQWNHRPLLKGLAGPDWLDGPGRPLGRLLRRLHLGEAASLRNSSGRRRLLRPSERERRHDQDHDDGRNVQKSFDWHLEGLHNLVFAQVISLTLDSQTEQK